MEANEKGQEMIKIRSNYLFLFINGQWMHILRPWRLEVDFSKRTVTIKKRNWHLISVDEDVLPFQGISAINLDKHLFGADIKIATASGKIIGKSFSKKKAKKLKELSVKLMDFSNKESSTTNIYQSNSDADELRKMKELLDEGIITQEDFDTKKSKLMNK